MKSLDSPTDPTLIVATPVSFFAQPAKLSPASPSTLGNSGSQKRRCEQGRITFEFDERENAMPDAGDDDGLAVHVGRVLR